MTTEDLTQIRTLFQKELKEGLKEGLKPVHKKLDKLQKDLKDSVRFLDNENLKTQKRVERIENHLGLPQPL